MREIIEQRNGQRQRETKTRQTQRQCWWEREEGKRILSHNNNQIKINRCADWFLCVCFLCRWPWFLPFARCRRSVYCWSGFNFCRYVYMLQPLWIRITVYALSCSSQIAMANKFPLIRHFSIDLNRFSYFTKWSTTPNQQTSIERPAQQGTHRKSLQTHSYSRLKWFKKCNVLLNTTM